MEQPNSGDRLEVWDIESGWGPFHEAYLIEATEYKLRYIGTHPVVSFQGISIPFYPVDDYFVTSWMTPFQSGLMTILINLQQYETYIYPDQRKLTEEQYHQMLSDIMTEAGVLFQYCRLEKQVDAYGKNRDISWTQWSYIEQNFYHLRQIFSSIERQPIRQLEKYPIMMRREKVQRAANETLFWLDNKGYGTNIPKNVRSVKKLETVNVYENRVLKQQLIDFRRFLKKYETVDIRLVSQKAKRFASIISSWISSPFFADVKENKGSYMITQRFRKHPIYRGWYQWFEKFYSHKHTGIGFSYPIPLKDTFQLYELWCYMMLIKVLRELEYVDDASGLFKTMKNGIFLDLAENKESRIVLKGGLSLFYQRNYQFNSREFHTYTQRMIPDIVIEGVNSMIIFDPKYRVPSNLGTALGEMHKYKDGIIHRDSGKRAVQEVYIITPTRDEDAEVLRYFDKDSFHKPYGMGAIQLVPGEFLDEFREKVLECIKCLD